MGGMPHAAGASSVEDEMVIDLFRYCNGVTAHVDPVGGGAIWETVHNDATWASYASCWLPLIMFFFPHPFMYE